MKRDLALIRQLAEFVANANGPIQTDTIQIDGFTDDEVAFNFDLMREAGLILADVLGSPNMVYSELLIHRLTWDGCDFHDAAKSNTTWNKVTKRIKDTVTTVPFDMLVTLLKNVGMEEIGKIM